MCNLINTHTHTHTQKITAKEAPLHNFLSATHLVKHVALPAREAAPVGEDHQRQALVVDVLDRLSCFVRAVGVPHTARLLR